MELQEGHGHRLSKAGTCGETWTFCKVPWCKVSTRPRPQTKQSRCVWGNLEILQNALLKLGRGVSKVMPTTFAAHLRRKNAGRNARTVLAKRIICFGPSLNDERRSQSMLPAPNLALRALHPTNPCNFHFCQASLGVESRSWPLHRATPYVKAENLEAMQGP